MRCMKQAVCFTCCTCPGLLIKHIPLHVLNNQTRHSDKESEGCKVSAESYFHRVHPGLYRWELFYYMVFISPDVSLEISAAVCHFHLFLEKTSLA